MGLPVQAALRVQPAHGEGQPGQELQQAVEERRAHDNQPNTTIRMRTWTGPTRPGRAQQEHGQDRGGEGRVT